MNNFIEYKILPEIRMIVVCYFGQNRISDILNHRTILNDEVSYNSNYNMLIDFRNCQLDIDEKDIKTYINYAMASEKMKGTRKIAFLSITPKETVFPYLYSKNLKHLPFKVNIFSTLKAAIAWLDCSDEDTLRIEDSIKNMNVSLKHV